MQRFDEIELQSVPLGGDEAPPAPDLSPSAEAPRLQRLLALLIDLSLFSALVLAMTPLLPAAPGWFARLGLGGFVLLTSYYYYVGSWLLWGKSVGGAIFDVRVVADRATAMSFKSASLRWLAVLASLATGGIGFAMAVLPSRRSLPDLLSETHCVTDF